MSKNVNTLAKLLAEEDIYVVNKKVQTAAFDVLNRELILPIWKDMSDNIVDLMTLHEVGHALWTPLSMLETAKKENIEFSFVNVLEDVRIEKFIQSKYKGAVKLFNAGYKELIKDNFFQTDGKDISSYNLIDRINLNYKHHSDIPFSEIEKVWVEKANKTVTPDDVLALAKEIYKFIEENEDSQAKVEDETAASFEADDENGNVNMDSEEKSNDKNNDESDNSMDGSSDNTGGDDGDNSRAGESNEDDSNTVTSAGGESGKTPVKDDGGKSEGPAKEPIKANTDNASKEEVKKYANTDEETKDRQFSHIPQNLDLDSAIMSFKEIDKLCKQKYQEHYDDLFYTKTLEELVEYKSSAKKSVSYMVKEFEMKKAADLYARAAVSKTGNLDMGLIHTYKYNDDLFKKVTTLPGATNHGMVLFLDWSGSMADNMAGTMKQLFNIVWFCNRVNIPFEVYAFSDRFNDVKQEFKNGDLIVESVKLLNFLSSKMKKSELDTMMHYMLMMGNRWSGFRDWSRKGYPLMEPRELTLGGTPLNAAIIYAMDILPKFKKDAGVQKVNTVFLTDGESNHLSQTYKTMITSSGNSYPSYQNSGRYGTIQVYVDPKTNKKIINEDRDQTKSFLKLLKARVPGMNVVGFFVAGSGRYGYVGRGIIENFFNWTVAGEMVKKIKKENVLVCKSEGYDEFYILPGANAFEKNESMDVAQGATKAQLKSAFGKMQNGKMTNRPVLNKFVAMVA